MAMGDTNATPMPLNTWHDQVVSGDDQVVSGGVTARPDDPGSPPSSAQPACSWMSSSDNTCVTTILKNVCPFMEHSLINLV